MKERMQRLAMATEGITSIEYGLIASLVAIAIVLSATGLGNNLKALYEAVAGSMP